MVLSQVSNSQTTRLPSRLPHRGLGKMVDYMTVINYIVDVLLWLSILAALLTLLTFSLFSELRTYPIKLIMYLCGTIVGAFAAIFFGNKDFIYGSWLCCT